MTLYAIKCSFGRTEMFIHGWNAYSGMICYTEKFTHAQMFKSKEVAERVRTVVSSFAGRFFDIVSGDIGTLTDEMEVDESDDTLHGGSEAHYEE